MQSWSGGSRATSSPPISRVTWARVAAAIFFEGEAFTVDNGYPWISILVNVPATLVATGYYEVLMRDSLVKIQGGHASHEEGEEGLFRHITKVSTDPGVLGAMQAVVKREGFKERDFGDGSDGKVD
jgi:hypothetical protein